MLYLNRPAFVLQRRINIPLDAVERILCEPGVLHEGMILDLGADAALRLDRGFGLAFPPFGLSPMSWRAFASVSARRGRRAENIELEINAWDRSSTELVVRPRARRLHQWSDRRVQRYFRVAHPAADVVVAQIGAQAARLESTRQLPAVAGAST